MRQNLQPGQQRVLSATIARVWGRSLVRWSARSHDLDHCAAGVLPTICHTPEGTSETPARKPKKLGLGARSKDAPLNVPQGWPRSGNHLRIQARLGDRPRSGLLCSSHLTGLWGLRPDTPRDVGHPCRFDPDRAPPDQVGKQVDKPAQRRSGHHRCR